MALEDGEVPVGALIVDGDRVIGEGRERTRARLDPAAHAEVQAVRAALEAVGAFDLRGTTMYSTVEPCVLCGYVARSAGIAQIVYGVPAGRLGACTSAYALLLDASIAGWPAPPAIVSGVLAADCAALLARHAERRQGHAG